MMSRDNLQALALCGLSLANYALFYVTSILLARTLSVRDFDDYNVAVSTVLVLVAIATLGLEKYALRCLPALDHDRNWSEARGFLRFSGGTIFVCSLALSLFLGVTLEVTLAIRGKDYHVAIVIVALFLPVMALFQFLLEVVTAYGGQVKGVAIYRLVFPICLLVLNTLVWVTPVPSNAVTAALCFGAAWIIALGMISALAWRHVPPPVWHATPTLQAAVWIRGALPLVTSSLILAAFAQTGVIVLELNHPNQAVVSAYALAFQTGTFVVILGTATNRLYAPKISALLASGDIQTMRAIARRRMLLIGPLTIVYLILIFAFGQSILKAFGPEFVSAYPAMCVIATGASISTLFALSPTYLHFTDRSRIVLVAMTASVGISLALCFPLSDRYGALGAAVAYAIPISVLHLGLRLYASWDLSRYSHKTTPR